MSNVSFAKAFFLNLFSDSALLDVCELSVAGIYSATVTRPRELHVASEQAVPLQNPAATAGANGAEHDWELCGRRQRLCGRPEHATRISGERSAEQHQSRTFLARCGSACRHTSCPRGQSRGALACAFRLLIRTLARLPTPFITHLHPLGNPLPVTLSRNIARAQSPTRTEPGRIPAYHHSCSPSLPLPHFSARFQLSSLSVLRRVNYITIFVHSATRQLPLAVEFRFLKYSPFALLFCIAD